MKDQKTSDSSGLSDVKSSTPDTETTTEDGFADLSKRRPDTPAFPLPGFLTKYLGLIFVVILGAVTWTYPCWQTGFVLASMITVTFLWFLCHRLYKKEKPDASIKVFLFSSIAFVTIATSLFNGLTAVGVMANIVITIFVTLHSRRYLYYGAIASIVSFCVSEIVRYYRLTDIIYLYPCWQLAIGLTFEVLLVSLAVFYLRRLHMLKDTSFETTDEKSAVQDKIVETAKRIHPIVQDTLEQINVISSDFSVKAAEQAGFSAETNMTTTEVHQIAIEMVDAAGRTQSLCKTTSQQLSQNSDRMQKVERGFGEVAETINQSRTEVNALLEKVERIEEILDYNREIGQQIKILAVNAAIEAAKAGNYGHGFRVVAIKLRELIHVTDDNLDRSRKLLDEIRIQSRESSNSILTGVNQMSRYFDDLRATEKTIEQSTAGFLKASEEVEQIGYAAEEQQIGMEAVTGAIAKLDMAATQLVDSSNYLREAVEKISSTQEELGLTLFL